MTKQITASDLANCKIRVTPEQSAKVQELAFSLGYRWAKKGNVISHTIYPILGFYSTTITYGNVLDFEDSHHREITYADLFPEAEEPITPEALREEIANKLIALKRYEITKYKSTPSKETLEYREHEEFGRFILASDLYKVINELLTPQP